LVVRSVQAGRSGRSPWKSTGRWNIFQKQFPEKHESGGSRDQGTGAAPERVSKELVMPPKSPNLYTSEKSLATLQIVRLRSGECLPVTFLSDSEIIEIAQVHVDMGDHQPGWANRRGPPKAMQ
jgi:hypothetical protein